jgi:hypothetical protein
MTSRQPHPQSTPRQRPNPQISQMKQFQGQVKHWAVAGLRLQCRMFTAKQKHSTINLEVKDEKMYCACTIFQNLPYQGKLLKQGHYTIGNKILQEMLALNILLQ